MASHHIPDWPPRHDRILRRDPHSGRRSPGELRSRVEFIAAPTSSFKFWDGGAKVDSGLILIANPGRERYPLIARRAAAIPTPSLQLHETCDERLVRDITSDRRIRRSSTKSGTRRTSRADLRHLRGHRADPAARDLPGHHRPPRRVAPAALGSPGGPPTTAGLLRSGWECGLRREAIPPFARATMVRNADQRHNVRVNGRLALRLDLTDVGWRSNASAPPRVELWGSVLGRSDVVPSTGSPRTRVHRQRRRASRAKTSG